jgi:hypothetical protein
MPEATSSTDQAKEQGVHTIAIQPRRALIAAMAVLGAAVIMIATAGRADAAAAQTKCPNTFRVLHDDHVGKLTLKAGSYDWQFIPEAGKTFTDTGTGSCHGAPSAPFGFIAP